MITALFLLQLFHSPAAPQTTDLDSDEKVIFFPTLAKKLASGGLEVPVHGWIFEPETRVETLAWFIDQLGLEAVSDPGVLERLTRLAAPFLFDNERGQRVLIHAGDQSVLSVPSKPNGHFTALLTLPAAAVATQPVSQPGTPETITFHAAGKPGDQRTMTGVAYVLEDSGLSVVSDIDDTIKISMVQDKSELLKNTFLRPFVPIDGMAALYAFWAAEHRAAFHYVSASPWQLFEPLAEFCQREKFPAGSFHMKTFRLKDQSFFSLFQSPEEYKITVIRELIRRFPRRRFVLVGDSGERDPEAYAALRREFPQNVAAILIRDVTGERGDSARYQRVFRDIPAALWRIFNKPVELNDQRFTSAEDAHP